MSTREWVVCAACKKWRSRNKTILEGWWTGPDGKPYCSETCMQTAPRPKGRGRPVFVRLTAPEGATVQDVERWRKHVAEEFAKLAVAAYLKEADREAQTSRLPGGHARELVIGDYDQVLALWKKSEGLVLRDVDRRKAIAKYLEANKGTSFVWDAGGRIVGAVLAGTDGRRGFLHHLAVDQSHRRRGVGRELVEHALAALARRGIKKSHLMVLPDNQGARDFWKKLGWVERTDVVLMSKTFAPEWRMTSSGPGELTP